MRSRNVSAQWFWQWRVRDLLLVLHLGDPPSNFAHGAPGNVGAAAELVSGRRNSF
jgi:hypothetical protein